MISSKALPLTAALILYASGLAHAQSAKTLVDQALNAMGGMSALRALKNQIVESEGKQFDSSSTPKPLGPARQIGKGAIARR